VREVDDNYSTEIVVNADSLFMWRAMLDVEYTNYNITFLIFHKNNLTVLVNPTATNSF